MPDLEKRRAAAERARRRKAQLKNQPPRTCEDCGATIRLTNADSVRCWDCLRIHNSAMRHQAGYRDDGRAA